MAGCHRCAVRGPRSSSSAALADPPATTYIPWQGWALATDDFLVTRLMEMVVHADDLAASVDVPTPDFGLSVLDPVFRLLTAIAVRRHGQDALVRTLTRPQRAPGDDLGVLTAGSPGPFVGRVSHHDRGVRLTAIPIAACVAEG